MPYSFEDLEKVYIWKYGMPPYHFWLRHVEDIRVLVKEHNLKPLSQKYFMAEFPKRIAEVEKLEMAGGSTVEMAGSVVEKDIDWDDIPRKFWPRPFPGGMRIPHVHLDGEIYMLKDEHWKELTEKVINKFRTKLANMKTVNFEQMMKLSAAFDEVV